MTASPMQPGVVAVMATPMCQTVQPMETPMNTNWEYGQYMPSATTTPQVFTPTVAAASTWPGMSPPARSPVSEQSSSNYDIVMQEPLAVG
eukprot:12926654-Prorocentrum_lima.AAC.1